MKRKLTSGITATVLALMMIIGSCFNAAAANDFVRAIGYKLTDTSGINILGVIYTGDSCNATVTFKVLDGTSPEDYTESSFRIASESSFVGNVFDHRVIIDGRTADTVSVCFTNLLCSKRSSDLRIRVTNPSTKEDQVIGIAVSEYDNIRGSSGNTSGSDEMSEPEVAISMANAPSLIKAGETYKIQFNIKNLSPKPTIESPVATVSPSEALFITDTSDTYSLPYTKGGQNTSFTVSLKAQDTISSEQQSITVSLRYNYWNGSSLVPATAEKKFLIQAEKTADSEVTAPEVRITRGEIANAVKSGDNVKVPVTIENLGSYELTSPVAFITTSDAFMLTDSTGSKYLTTIAAGGKTTFDVPIKVLGNITNPQQSIDISFKFYYTAGGSRRSGEATEKLYIPVVLSMDSDETKPVLQITKSEIKGTVSAGESVTVTVNVKNIGGTVADKPIAFFTAPDSFLLDQNTSSEAIANIEPGKSVSFTVKLKATERITSAQQALDVNVKYYYTIGGTRSSGEATEKLYIPVTVTRDDGESKPVFEITRNEIKGNIAANEAVDVVVTVKNIGSAAAVKPIVFITAPDSFMLNESTSSRVLDDIAPGKSASFTVKLKALDAITAPTQFLNIELQYTYSDGKSRQNGTSTEKIYIPVTVTEKDTDNSPAPLVEISREPMAAVKAGKNFAVTVTLKNLSGKTLENPVVQYSPSEAFIINETSASKILEPIAPGETASVIINLVSAEKISSESQSLGIDLSYSYLVNGSRQSGNASEKVQIPAVVTADADGANAATPNIILSKYDFGGDSVVTGRDFDLSFSFKNTSKNFRVENIVMKIDPEEGLSITAASNTYYYENLGAGKEHPEKITLQALPTAKAGSAKVNISFSYEYVSNGTRSSQSSSQSIAIPLVQEDRFEVSLAELPEYADAGSEYYVTVNYINKGKADISNVHAEITGDDVPALEKEQNLGNFESGKSGTIDFILTPYAAGPVNINVVITYEDPNMKEKTIELPVSFTVNEMIMPDLPDDPTIDPDMPSDGEGGGFPTWAWVIIAIVIIGGAAAFIIIKKKRGKKKDEVTDFKWEDELDPANDVKNTQEVGKK